MTKDTVTCFHGRTYGALVRPVAIGPAIIPSISGWARQTGINTIFTDDRDAYAHGFVVT
ncbi:proline racemase family protein [Psychromarinibacter halotolerans]|nr:proline racemase family protein [Psychromarinibacter halotolerans]MDF0597385.1 proline racemase family protein [Psychromarinibacter halotolerans]